VCMYVVVCLDVVCREIIVGGRRNSTDWKRHRRRNSMDEVDVV